MQAMWQQQKQVMDAEVYYQELVNSLKLQVEQHVARLTEGRRAEGLNFAEYKQGKSLAAYGM